MNFVHAGATITQGQVIASVGLQVGQLGLGASDKKSGRNPQRLTPDRPEFDALLTAAATWLLAAEAISESNSPDASTSSRRPSDLITR